MLTSEHAARVLLVSLCLLVALPSARAEKKPRLPPLLAAIERGDLNKVKQLARNKKALVAEFSSEDGSFFLVTPLRLAARSGRAPIVAALLDAGAPPSFTTCTEATGSVEVVRLLLERKVSCEETIHPGPLLTAARFGRTEVLRVLLEAGIRPGKWSDPVVGAAKSGHAACVRLLLEAGFDPNQRPGKPGAGDRTALMLAAEFDQLEAVQALLEHKADVALTDSRGWTALHHAAANDKASGDGIVKALLAAGAAADARSKDGTTPVMLAAANAPILVALLAAGADAKLADENGCTVLHRAAMACKLVPEAVAAMRKAGLEASQPDAKGATPLHLYLKRGCVAPEAIGLLLEAGNKPDAVDGQGVTPLGIAAANGSTAVVELLLAKGADPRVGESAFAAALPCRYDTSFGGSFVRECHGALALTLVRAGAPIESSDNPKYGRSALHLAVESGNAELVAEVLERQPELVGIADAFRRLPLHLAAYRCQLAMVEKLLEKGADRGALDHKEASALDLVGDCRDGAKIRALLAAPAAKPDGG